MFNPGPPSSPSHMGLLHACVHVIAGCSAFRWKALIWGWDIPWRLGHPTASRWLAVHHLAIVLLHAGMLALLGMGACMGMGWGQISTTPCTLLLLRRRLLQCPHTADIIRARLILVCGGLPGEAGGLELWVSGPEHEPVPALGGWGLQAHGFQGTGGRPTAWVGTH